MNHIASANRVATMIGTIKWVVIGLIGLGVLIGFLSGIASGDGSGVAIAFLALIMGAVYGVMTYVFFGWLEQTLRMLASIATNTAPPVGAPASPYAG